MATPRTDRSGVNPSSNPTSDPRASYANLATQVQASQGILTQLQGQPIDETLADRARLTGFQAHLTGLQAAVSPAAQGDKLPRLAAIDIEIRKQLRLIQLDGQFLGTARQPATLTDRLESIRAHLELLDRYAQGALLLLTPSDPP
jgi:hypothetical protein